MRWLRDLPAVLLVAVACNQVWLAHVDGLSPWLGGGFGMFSTTDTWSRRHLHAWALYPGLRREVTIPPDAGRLVRRALALPTSTHLRALALALTEVAERDAGRPDAIELQVWAPRFDAMTLAPSSALLRSMEVPVACS
jgi:hypothetical protein